MNKNFVLSVLVFAGCMTVQNAFAEEYCRNRGGSGIKDCYEQGRMVRTIVPYNAVYTGSTSTEIYQETTYKYNSSGLMISGTCFDYQKNQITQVNEYKYDDNNKLVSFIMHSGMRYDSNGKMIKEPVWEYSCNGGGYNNCINQTQIAKYTNTYDYDLNGNLSKKYTDGILVESYNYNTDGSYTVSDSSGQVLGKYNADGSVFIPKRIYTVKEATDAVSGKNTFSIKYR